jgi:RNA polymerase sigma-70 factor (ECF subfamily)
MTAASDIERPFSDLVEAHRTELHAHCYRMLGSLHDADDALQETLLRAWRALPRFRGDSSLRTWLYRIATNVCLDTIARRPRRVLPIDYPPTGEPVSEPVWIEPYPDETLGVEDGAAGPDARYEQREALELAFVATLQHLPPRPRAVLILRDVLGFSAKEAAESLQTSVASVNGAVQRARRAVADRLPEGSQQRTLRTLGDRRLREIVERFADAFEGGEVDTIVAMLTDDATFGMPPYATWCRGRDAVAESWLMPEGAPPRLRMLPTRANGQPAVGAYLLDPSAGSYLPLALDVLTLRGDRIAGVTAFRTPSVFARFGLPPRIPDHQRRPS